MKELNELGLREEQARDAAYDLVVGMAQVTGLIDRLPQPAKGQTDKVRAILIQLMLDAVKQGVPIRAMLNHVHSGAIRDVIETMYADDRLSITNKSGWLRELTRFLASDKTSSNSPTDAPADADTK